MNVGAIGSLLVQQNLISSADNTVPVETESFASMLERAKKTNQGTAETHGDLQGSRSQKVTIDRTSKLYEQCEALESFLIKNLLNGMRKTVMKSELMDEGFAGKMYEDMLYDEYANRLTKNSGFGLADMAYLELTGQRGKVIGLDHPPANQ
ncbi:MAG TPA: rod-binding protein [Treponema sp.]|nr:rod-binding protein [Treponema sp.]HRU28527.1 rod-binding protein [Treponema sp.]